MRYGNDLGSDCDGRCGMALSLANAAGQQELQARGDGGLVRNLDGTDLCRHQPTWLSLCRDRNEPLRRGRRGVSDHDGVDTAGIVFNTTPNMPNIEDQESEYPVLYLFRRHLQDSGGPGKFRGGRSGELAYTIYDAPTGQLEGLFAGTGAEMPNAIGVAGGLPGSAISIARVVKTDIKKRIAAGEVLPDRLKTINGELEWLICKHVRSPILAGDVWYHSWQGGGGYGDPILRDPDRVATDVERGAVSEDVCANVYGVALSADGKADHDATKAKREQLRAARKASAKKASVEGLNWSYKGKGRTEIAQALS